MDNEDHIKQHAPLDCDDVGESPSIASRNGEIASSNDIIVNIIKDAPADDESDSDTPKPTLLQRQVARSMSIPGAHAIEGPNGSSSEFYASRDEDCDVENPSVLPSSHPSTAVVDDSPVILTATLVQDEDTLDGRVPGPPSLVPTLTATTPVLVRAEPAEDKGEVATTTNSDGGDMDKERAVQPVSRSHLVFYCCFVTTLLILSGLGLGLAFALRPNNSDSLSLRASPSSNHKKEGNHLDDEHKDGYSHSSSSRSHRDGNHSGSGYGERNDSDERDRYESDGHGGDDRDNYRGDRRKNNGETNGAQGIVLQPNDGENGESGQWLDDDHNRTSHNGGDDP